MQETDRGSGIEQIVDCIGDRTAIGRMLDLMDRSKPSALRIGCEVERLDDGSDRWQIRVGHPRMLA